MRYQPTEEIFLCNDGKYRWVYEKSLFRDPSILFLLFKVMGITVLIIWAMFMFFFILDSADLSELAEATKFTLMMFGVILILCCIGYLLYALIMGGSYCVVFTMDEKGVLHSQQNSQVKKANIMSELVMLMGAASGNPTFVGTGMLSTRSEMYTKFSSVRTIKTNRKWNTIHLGGNQVYARDEDFDFVLEYIQDHCPNAAGDNHS